MTLLRRLSAIALQCALLTTWAVGSGFTCELGAGHASHMAMGATPMSDMPMDMPGMPGMPAHEPGNGASHESAESHSDCDFPWSSGDCEAMTSCAPNAMQADQPSFTSAESAAHEEPAWRANQLRSVARSPEPPPPRA